MRLFVNTKRVKANARLGKILTWGGLGIMAVGLLLSFSRPEETTLVMASALVGIIASQWGISLVNRWSRGPRMDEVLNDSLRGSDDSYAIFHYIFRNDHVLFAPSGVFALMPMLEDGMIEFEDGKWIQRKEKSGLLRRPLNRPIQGVDSVAAREAEILKKALLAEGAADPELQVKPLLVFMHRNAEVKPGDADLLAVHAKKLKTQLRKLPRGASVSPQAIEDLARKYKV